VNAREHRPLFWKNTLAAAFLSCLDLGTGSFFVANALLSSEETTVRAFRTFSSFPLRSRRPDRCSSILVAVENPKTPLQKLQWHCFHRAIH
jgi:hypothetical protein